MSFIEIKNLTFGYDKSKKVLNDLSVSFDQGKTIALIGKNGSGKSTLLDCLLGVNDYEGTITIDECNIKYLSDKEYARLVSFIPQSVQINIDYSIRDFISFGRNPHTKLGLALTEDDYRIVEENAARCGIADLLNKNINKVSGGERQLAFIARALTQETPIIIMDEPTAALDFGNQQKLFKIMKSLMQEGKTIVFTTHNPNHLINFSCEIYAVNNGSLAKVEKLNNEVLKELYGEVFKQGDEAFLFDL